MGRTWLEDLALKSFPAEKRMIPGTGPDVMLRLKVPSALKRTIGTAGLLAVLIISALSLSAASATSAVSFRAGLQPEGARLVIDLDRPVKYSLSPEGSKVIIDIRAESAEERSGNFPNNRVASSFSARPTAGGTSLEINLRSPVVTVKHYTLPSPERIVVDISPSPGATGQDGQNPRVFGIHGLVRAPLVTGPGKGYTDLRLSPEEMVLEEGFTARTFPFEVPFTRRIVEGSSFIPVLVFDADEGEAQARVSFTLNGVPVGDTLLQVRKGSGTGTRIELPPGLIRPGVNRMTLAVSAYPESGRGPTGGTLRILDGSFLRLRYLSASDVRLKDIGAFIDGSLSPEGEDLAVVLPERPEPEEIQAALEMVMEWNGGRPSGQIRARILTPGLVDSETARYFHTVYLGRSPLLPLPVLQAFRSETPPGDKGFLSAFVDSYGKFRLLVTSDTAGGVLSGTLSLMDLSLRDRFDTRRAFITPGKTLSARETEEADGTFTLKELTGGDIVLSAAGTRERRMILTPPPVGKIGGPGEVSLTFRSSHLLDGERSTLGIELNGAPADTVKLGRSSASEKDRLTAKIPEKLLGQGPLEIGLRAVLEPAGGKERELPGDVFWVVVDGSSQVRTPLSTRRLPSLLEYLPYQLTGGEISLFVGPEPMDGMLSAVAGILADWQRTLGKALEVKVKPLSQLEWENLKGDAIVASDLEKILSLGIPIAAVHRKGETVISRGRSVKARLDLERDVFIQLISRKSRGLGLVLGWPGRSQSGTDFFERFHPGELKGDVFLVSDGKEAAHFYLETPEPRAGLFGPSPEKGQTGRVILGVSALGMSLALLWFLVYLGRRRERP